MHAAWGVGDGTVSAERVRCRACGDDNLEQASMSSRVYGTVGDEEWRARGGTCGCGRNAGEGGGDEKGDGGDNGGDEGDGGKGNSKGGCCT